MQIQLVSLFPKLLAPWFESGILARAIKNKIISVKLVNPRDWARDPHNRVDDYVYGGGPGMLLKPDVLAACLTSIKRKQDRVVALVPGGHRLDNRTLGTLSTKQGLILIAGRYEGFDARFLDSFVDERVSLGDYVVMGGEAPAIVLIEGIVRRIKGVLSDAESFLDDSFEDGLLEEDSFTRPADFGDAKIPEVLLSGNHAKITAWRRASSLKNTYIYRPDLLINSIFGANEQTILKNCYKELFCGQHHTGNRRKIS